MLNFINNLKLYHTLILVFNIVDIKILFIMKKEKTYPSTI